MGEAGDDPMLVLTFLKSSSNRFLISASFSAKNFLNVGQRASKRMSISALMPSDDEGRRRSSSKTHLMRAAISLAGQRGEYG